MSVHVRLRIGRETYSLPVEHVLEVAELGEVTPVPGAQRAVLGVRNLRGQILPIVDLATVFGIESSGRPARVVVAESNGLRAGFAIDEVSDIEQLPDAIDETESDLLVGAALTNDELVGVVDVERLFRSLEQEGAVG
jgi:two-component system chemotaxis response regulator CheV